MDSYAEELTSPMLGVTETLGTFYIPSAYRDAIGFVLMVVFLLFRPQGLFGQK